MLLSSTDLLPTSVYLNHDAARQSLPNLLLIPVTWPGALLCQVKDIRWGLLNQEVSADIVLTERWLCFCLTSNVLIWLMINQIWEVCLDISPPLPQSFSFCGQSVQSFILESINLSYLRLLRLLRALSSCSINQNHYLHRVLQPVIWLVWIRPTVWKKSIISDFD